MDSLTLKLLICFERLSLAAVRVLITNFRQKTYLPHGLVWLSMERLVSSMVGTSKTVLIPINFG